jgi:hypothetical protein
MPKLNISVYAEGCMYPAPTLLQPVATTIAQLQQSGFQTVLLGLFHIQSSGGIHFNNTQVVANGSYVGDPTWPGLIAGLLGGTVTRVCASIGGGGVGDFAAIKTIYHNNYYSFSGTALMSNFQTLRATFPSLAVIDLDCEEAYDVESFVAFCQMLIGMGFDISFCPYQRQAFWIDSLAVLNASNPGAVVCWNLQCYDGGGGNEPADWAGAIAQAIPAFSTAGFIVPGDWTNDNPTQVQSLMASFQQQDCVGGGFMWTLDDIIANAAPLKPVAAMKAYADAISVGLGNVL